MDQLIVLHEIYESFSKGLDKIQSIDPASVEGNCSEPVVRLLSGAKQGKIDQDICSALAEGLEDVYEMKRLGDICRKARLFPLAIKSYNRALSQSRDQNIRPVLLNNLGQVYARQGDIGRANVYYKKAAEGFESADDSSGLAHVLRNLAAAYRRNKDWDKAIEHCYKSLKIFEGMGDELGIAQMNGSLGRVYSEMGERDLAFRYFEKSLKDFQRLGDKRSAAWVLDRLGRIYAEMKDWNSALRYYNKSIGVFDEIGQSQSAGIVQSNLGRMHLEKGETTAAKDSLEKAVKLMHRDMQPAYQNAVACMAATYSSLAARHMQEAEFANLSGSKRSAEEKMRLASQFYTRASDRYLELASTRGFDLSDLKASAGITRSLSYLALLSSGVPEEESVALAERAASALDSAVVNSEGPEKASIEAFQRTLHGMREVLSAGLAGSEPWKIIKSIANSTEYLLGGNCRSDEAGRCLSDALAGLRGAIEAERHRGDPSERLEVAVSHLEKAKKIFAAGADSGNEDVFRIDCAAKSIEWLIDTEIASGRAASEPSRASDMLNYRAYREALMVIGKVLMKDALSRVNKTDRIYVWDDYLNPARQNASDDGSEAKIEIDQIQADPVSDQAPWPIPEGVELCYADKGITDENLIEIIEPEIADDFLSEEISPGGWLVPVEMSIAHIPCSAQVIMLPKEEVARRTVEIVDPKVADRRSESEEAGRVDVNAGHKDEPQKNSDCKTSWYVAGIKGLFTQPNAMRLVKAMLIIVVVLLAIDVILYLI